MPANNHNPHAELAPFRVDVHPERDVVRVAAVGELDVATVTQVQAQISELRDAGFKRVVLDLRQLTFMDSGGVALILDEDRCALRDGHTFALITGPPVVQRVLDVCCGDDLRRLCSPVSHRRDAVRERPAAPTQPPTVPPLAPRRHLRELRRRRSRA